MSKINVTLALDDDGDPQKMIGLKIRQYTASNHYQIGVIKECISVKYGKGMFIVDLGDEEFYDKEENNSHEELYFENKTPQNELFELLENDYLYTHNELITKIEILIANKKNIINDPDENGNHPLYYVTKMLSPDDKQNNITIEEIVRLLLINGADPNGESLSDQTPLMISSSTGNITIPKMLIENGADINKADAYGQTALSFSVSYCHLELSKFLIESGANISNYDKNLARCILGAYEKINYKIIMIFEEYDLYIYDIFGEIVWGDYLIRLLQKGNNYLYQFLANNNLYIDVDNKEKINVSLKQLNFNEANEITHLLFSTGMNFNHKYENGMTTLIFAIISGCYEYSKFILENGTDIEIRDNEGHTALEYAIRTGQTEIIDLLQNY